MQAHFSGQSRDQCALVSSTSDGRERNDRPFGAAVMNNFSIRRAKRMMIAIRGNSSGAGAALPRPAAARYHRAFNPQVQGRRAGSC